MTQTVGIHKILCSGPADLAAAAQLIESGALRPGEIVAVMGKTEGNGCVNDFTRDFAKAEAGPDGRVRGARHTMLNDSDINSTRHARAAVGAVLASVMGQTAIHVSGGAEHQGLPGGGPFAIIART